MLTSTTYARAGATVIRLSGILNSRTYQQARDAVTKVATDRAVAVIIDINALDVGDRESWAVFINARWSVQQWPGVPMVLVTGDPLVRQRLVDLSVVRNVPVYETLDDAIDAIGGGTCRYRYRAREQFGAHYSSVNSALIFVHEHLVAWSLRDRVPAVSTVMTVFAENALTYATDGFDVRLEGSDDEVVLAVSDSSPALAVRRERAPGRCPARPGHRLGAMPSLGQHSHVRGQDCVGADRSRRVLRHAHRPVELRLRPRRGRSARAHTVRRTVPLTVRGGRPRPTNRARTAPAGRGW